MKPIEALANGRQAAYYKSVIAAERAGYCRQSIYEVIRGKRKHHRNLTWRFASPVAKLGEFIAAQCCSDDRRCPVMVTALYGRFVASLPEHERPSVDLQSVCAFVHKKYGIDRAGFYDFVRGLHWADWGTDGL